MLDYGTHHPQVYCGALKPTHYVLWNDQALPIMLGNVLVSPLGRDLANAPDITGAVQGHSMTH
jgi:hypothetical protein